jgi:hypothetical protein
MDTSSIMVAVLDDEQSSIEREIKAWVDKHLDEPHLLVRPKADEWEKLSDLLIKSQSASEIDSGVLYDLGYFYRSGKPIVGYFPSGEVRTMAERILVGSMNCYALSMEELKDILTMLAEVQDLDPVDAQTMSVLAELSSRYKLRAA